MIPDEKVLLDNLGKIAYTLDKAYIPRLRSDYGVWYFDEKFNRDEAITYESNIRAVQVKRWVFDRDEKPGECFKNVLSSFADGDHTIAMAVRRTAKETEMFFVVKNEGPGRNEQSADNADLLESVIKGNFAGSEVGQVDIDKVKENFSFSNYESVAVIESLPSEYSEDHITQGLDKLLEGIIPKDESEEYTIVFLAESLAQSDLRDILSGYEDMATAVFPFAGYQFQAGSSNVETHGEMKSISNSKSISESIFRTHSVNIGINGGVNNGRSKGISVNTGEAGQLVGEIAGGLIAGPLGAILGRTVGSLAPSFHVGENEGGSIGGSLGYGYSWGKSKTVSTGTTETEGTNSSVSIGKSENTSYTYKSYMVQNIIQKLELTMDRLTRSQASGLWKFAAYVFSTQPHMSLSVANYLRALTQGKESFAEPSIIQEWSDESGGSTSNFKEIRKYLSHFCHPLFVTLDAEGTDGMFVSPTSYVSTDELGYVFSFPRKSVQGLPVLEGVQFGREPHALINISSDLEIGSGYHMHQIIKSSRIKLSKEELTKHTFITGSTGSGKSNTIYKLLDSLGREKVKFLVIEPAKGEYKDVLGKRKGVTAYGTNPKLDGIELLKINPFSFPESTHVLEHLDRLIEIFNVCWPMYAAMPAILKDSVERAYAAAGWDMEKSENKYGEPIYPTFSDVVKQIKKVLAESNYSNDNKGDYTGALVTRLSSLTTGINRLIFTSEDCVDEDLFDSNVIVDLSRVGSSETKALIMGLLVLKLQEHRMDQRANDAKMDSSLKHVTVLEEAHNLLRRTSFEQSGEGSNLLGKSVEMLSNSIAEMRTYGEGFIIADQSPGLLDMSVIRNTNTKIIMKLPDYSDRELVGRSAGLNDSQINEISRFEQGVASITQSDWLEPVLCKIDKYEVDGEPFENTPGSKSSQSVSKARDDTEEVKKCILECIMNREVYRPGDRIDIQKLRREVLDSGMETGIKCRFLDYIEAGEETVVEKLRALVYEFFHAERAIDLSGKRDGNVEKWVRRVVEGLEPNVTGYTGEQVDRLVGLILYEKWLNDTNYTDIFTRFAEIYKRKGSVY